MTPEKFANALAIAGLSSFLLIANAHAAPVTNAGHAAVKPGYATDMADWLSDPGTGAGTQYGWNPLNARLGSHPDRPNGVVYIFPDAAAANTWWDGTTLPAPTDIPDTAVAYIHWDLDNGTGEFPGIMGISDDYSFNANNCIMASGATIPSGDPKTCSNPPGTSKRFKMVVLKTGAPIDLHFNTYAKDLVFNNVDDADFATAGLTTADLFRAYRYLIKWGNGTGTDSGNPAVAVDGDRIGSFSVSVGDAAGAPIAGLTFEASAAIDGYLLNNSNNNPRTLWNPNEFATFSPSMYSIVGDSRAPDGGFWDKAAAGMFPPATVGATTIDSGNSITGNYLDVKANIASAAGLPVYAGDFFGNMMYYGIISAGDTGQLPVGIYKDDDGDPATEGGIHTWWDGSDFRWGVEGKVIDGVIDADAWDVVSNADLAVMAWNELDPNAVAPFAGPKYEIAHADDLGGLNVDVYVKLDDNYVAGTPFTVRLQATAAAAGTDGDWVTTPPPTLADLRTTLPNPGATSGGGGGCAVGTGTERNITMPAMLIGLLGYGLLRIRRKQQ
jgi:hypothetical protein